MRQPKAFPSEGKVPPAPASEADEVLRATLLRMKTEDK